MVFYAQSTKRDRQTETDRQSMCVREREREREGERERERMGKIEIFGLYISRGKSAKESQKILHRML